MAIDQTYDNAADVLDPEAGRGGLRTVPDVRDAWGRYSSPRVRRRFSDVLSFGIVVYSAAILEVSHGADMANREEEVRIDQ